MAARRRWRLLRLTHGQPIRPWPSSPQHHSSRGLFSEKSNRRLITGSAQRGSLTLQEPGPELAARAELQAAVARSSSNAGTPPPRSAHSLGPKDRGCAFLRGSCDRNCNRLGYPSDVRDCHQRAHAGAAEPPGRTLSRAPWPLIETAGFITPEFVGYCNLKAHKFTEDAPLACVAPSCPPNRFQYGRIPCSGSSASQEWSPIWGKCARGPWGPRNPDIGQPPRQGEFVRLQSSSEDGSVASDDDSTSNRKDSKKRCWRASLRGAGNVLSGVIALPV
jgi:hypothetical protein